MIGTTLLLILLLLVWLLVVVVIVEVVVGLSSSSADDDDDANADANAVVDDKGSILFSVVSNAYRTDSMISPSEYKPLLLVPLKSNSESVSLICSPTI